MTTAPDGRLVFTWHDNNVDELANVIASTIELFNHGGALVSLNGSKLNPINLTEFHELIKKHICGVRVVAHNSGYKKEYFSYDFAPIPHPGPRTMAQGLPRWEDSREPDMKTLSEIYGNKILKLVPKVCS